MKCRQREYIVKKQNRIDIQTGYQCSAFSVAYLLRHYGIDANGADIYNQMPHKMKDGCVYPKGLPKVLQEYGLCAKYYSGNLKALQNEVCKGTPVIVMIRVRTDGNGVNGQVTDIKIVSDQLQKSKQRLNRILAENTGKTIEEICRDTERNNFMTAAEALQYGLIDQVIEKR